MRAIRLYMQLLQLFSPNAAVNQIYKFMSNPRVHKLRTSEEEVLDTATQRFVSFDGFQLKRYYWGEANQKKALLIHGWEGQAGNFAALITTLRQKGYQVLLYDAPSHGSSSKGPTNMFQFADFMDSVVAEYQPNLVISHSFGSVTTAKALIENRAVPIDHWIMVTTPYLFRNRINGVADVLGVSKKVVNRLVRKLEKELNQSMDELNMFTYCKQLTQVKKATLVHSKTDKILPINNSIEVNKAFPNSELVELDNLGHYAILWSDELKKIVENA